MINIKCKVDLKLKSNRPKPAESVEAPVPQRRGKVPRVARLMALAIQMDEMLRTGEAMDTMDLAEMGRVTQPRITQILSLSLLAPDIQEALLNLPREMIGKSKICEKNLRPLTTELHWDRQRELWEDLCTSSYNGSNCPRPTRHQRSSVFQ